MSESSWITGSGTPTEPKRAPVGASVADRNGGEILTRFVGWIRKTLNDSGNGIGRLTLLFVGVPALLSLGARWHWSLELLTHFRVYYAFAFAIGGTLCLLGRRWRYVAVIGLFLVWQLAAILPLYMMGPTTGKITTGKMSVGAAYGETLRGITVNVLTGNKQRDEFIAYLRQENPDFVFLMEINEPWAEALQVLSEDYPHHFTRWRGGAFGVAFYSRVPTRSIDIEYFGSQQIPSLVVELTDADGRDFTVVGTHPLPPVSAENAAARNEQLSAVAAAIAEMTEPVMLVGDLNMTSWSPYFGDFVEAADLVDSRLGFGVQGTWSPNSRSPFALPIDHVLTTDEFFINDRRVGPDIGSDHRPVVVDFQVLTKSVSVADGYEGAGS